MRLFLICYIFFLFLPHANAGAWNSGGGELIKDRHNPWFIQNTEIVRYCIIRDRNHFKLNEDEGFPLDWLINKAVEYWNAEFQKASNPLGGGTDGVLVGTQIFQQISCDGGNDPDLVFQFGYLSPEQLEKMEELELDPKDYVSLAVRTDYDKINLKGKGFIYVAADSGPLKPDSSEMVDYPWAQGSGGLLFHVLVHELGHVFGIQHQTDKLSVMATEYPENVVKNGDLGYRPYARAFFNFDFSQMTSFCYNADLFDFAARFFGVPAGWDCFQPKVEENSLTVLARQTTNSPLQTIGTATFHSDKVFDYRPTVQVWLPDEQVVYGPNPHREGRVLWGPMVKYQHRKGLYETSDGTLKPITTFLSPELPFMRFGAHHNGEMIIDVMRGM